MFGLTCMSAGVVECENYDIVRETLLEDLYSFVGLFNHFLGIPPSIIAFATAILNGFGGEDLFLRLLIEVPQSSLGSTYKLRYH